MKIFKEIESYRDWRKSQRGTIGCIPTMGALHEGHLSLIEKSGLPKKMQRMKAIKIIKTK